jgi:2'-5' RNA ligase
VRLFVAVWPPPPVVAALAELEHPDVHTVRWTPSARWHITLVFLGDAVSDGRAAGEPATAPVATAETTTGEAAVGEDAAVEDAVAVDDAVARLGQVPVANHARTVARLGAVTECFGRSVLYVPVMGLDALAASVRTAYAAARHPSAGPSSSGPPSSEARSAARAASAARTTSAAGTSAVDPAPFTGHLTVGRSRRHRDDVRPLAGLPVGPAAGMEWPVHELALVASVLRGGKGRYETVATLSVPGDDYPTSNMRSGLQ